MDNRIKKFYRDTFTATDSFSEKAKSRVKENIFSKLQTTVSPTVGISFWEKLRGLFFKSYVLVPLVVLLFISGTTYVSADALPGDTLYGVKRKVEDARLLIAPNEEARLDLQVHFAEKRLREQERIREKNSQDIESESEAESKDLESSFEHSEDRRSEAHDEAKDAQKFLEDTQKRFRDEGKDDKARDIEKRMENFRINLDDNSGHGNHNDDDERDGDEENSDQSHDEDRDDNSESDSDSNGHGSGHN